MNELYNLYDLILDNLISLNRSLGKSFNIQSYLQSLQPDVKQLRNSFNTNHVNVDYSSSKTQAAYLLAYYPHYVEMTYRALESLQQKDPSLMQLVFDKKHLKICLFCAGAAPEALGLLSFIRQFYPEVKSIVIYSYDLYSDTWRMSQDITKNIINNCFKDYHFALLARTLNINYDKDIMKIMPTIESSDIFILQNCLNELETNQLQSINFLLHHQPERSLLLINDLKKHKIAQNMTWQIQSQISDTKLESKRKYNQEIFRQFAGDDDFKSCIQIPSVLRENLLTGENLLIPKKNTSYSYVCVYKVFSDVENFTELDTFYNPSDLLEQVNRLQTQFNSFDARLEKLLAVESNYLEISEIVESYDQKLEEFQTNLQKHKDTTQVDIDGLMLKISNQQEILEREKQSFNNLVDNLDIKIQQLELSNNEFKNLAYNLETLKSNVQNLELMDSEQGMKLKKLEEFQTILQKEKDTTQADIDELMLKISNQQEILEREKQSFNNLVNTLIVKIQLLESSNNEFKSLNLISSLENIRFNIQNLGRMNSDREIKLNELERIIYNKLEVFQTNLQKQKDITQADINKIANQQEVFKKDFNNLSNDLGIKIQLLESNNNEFKNLGSNLESLKFNIQNLGRMNSDQEIKLNEIERTLNHFIHEERKNLTRQLERNRKAVIFAILSSWLGVILGVIALF